MQALPLDARPGASPDEPGLAFFDHAYAHFTADVQQAVREETYGVDIGQTSWLTVDELGCFARRLGLRRSTRILDVACGSGGPALHLAEHYGCTVTGIDFNEHGVATARSAAEAAQLSSRANFRAADATRSLPFADASFDGLLCIDSMNHLPDRLHTLCEWHRLLVPGGRAVFTDPVVVAGCVTAEDLAVRSSIGPFVFAPAAVNEQLIAQAGFQLLSQLDLTENEARIAHRWREARARFRDELTTLEGARAFEGAQRFLEAAHRLSAERRLARIAYWVEKPRA